MLNFPIPTNYNNPNSLKVGYWGSKTIQTSVVQEQSKRPCHGYRLKHIHGLPNAANLVPIIIRVLIIMAILIATPMKANNTDIFHSYSNISKYKYNSGWVQRLDGHTTVATVFCSLLKSNFTLSCAQTPRTIRASGLNRIGFHPTNN